MPAEMTNYRSTSRCNGKCKRCKARFTRLTLTITEVWRNADTGKVISRSERFTGDVDGTTRQPAIECCGAHVWMRPVKGIKNAEIVCGSKCTGATGHVCECACGGRNHGAGSAAA